jgi:hypothetical protein
MATDPGDNTGYRRPPKRTQFKKGQSGNPRGRPRGPSSFKSDLDAELREKLVLTENGREKRITKQRAFIKTLTAAAIKKDIRAVNALLACMRLFGVGNDEPPVESQNTSPTDLALLESYLVRQRQQTARAEKEAKTRSRERKHKP